MSQCPVIEMHLHFGCGYLWVESLSGRSETDVLRHQPLLPPQAKAVRLDVASQYADNLLHFLHALQARLANATFTISCGEPARPMNAWYS